MSIKPKVVYTRLRNFMLEFNVGINGAHDLFTWSKKIAKEENGKCMLMPNSRQICPCKEAVKEIVSENKCRAWLFSNRKKYKGVTEFVFLPHTKLRVELHGKLR